MILRLIGHASVVSHEYRHKKRQREGDRTQSTLEMHKSKIFEHLELRVGE